MKHTESSPMLRRARLFFAVFALAGAACLVYVFSQPPVYLASARVNVEFLPPQQGDTSSAFLKLTQDLSGGAMMDSAWRRLGGAGATSAEALRAMLSAQRVPGADAIELRAEGTDRDELPRVLEAWIEVWSAAQGVGDRRSEIAALEEARAAAEKLAQEVAARRGEIGELQAKLAAAAAVPGQVPDAAPLKELEDAASEARGREANAEMRLNALRESAAAGRAPASAQSAAVAQLEKQASDVRLAMRNLEQDYTPLYLGHDPRYQSLRSDLTRLEQQIDQEKQAGARQALQKAEEDAAGTRQTALKLQEELAAGKRAADESAARGAEHTALADNLARLEEAHATARERLAQLDRENESKATVPRLTVLGRPAVSDRLVRPDYWRDGLLGLAGSAVLGFVAVFVAGFFRRREPRRSDFAAPPGTRPDAPPDMADGSGDVPASRAASDSAAWLPTMSGRFSRELSGSEVHALWRAAAPDARIVISGLLGGLSLEELAALRYDHVDFDACYVRVPGISGRSCTLRDPLRRLLLERRAAHGGGAPLADAQGERLTVAEVDGLVARAARDAGLANAGQVAAETLSHTYFAYLVRQGARFAEIGEFIGRISPAAHREYSVLAAPGPGRPMEEIDPVFPALRELQ